MNTTIYDPNKGENKIIKRGLVVLSSYEGSGRDLEAHFYFPWQDTKWKRKAISVTKFAKPPRVATSIRDMKKAVKSELPEGWDLDDWWKKYRTEEHRPVVRWRGTDIELRSDFRFEFPAKLRKKHNVKAGDTRYPMFPIPRGTNELITTAKEVLRSWLEENQYMIPPLKKGDWFDKESGEKKIGVELERRKRDKLKGNEFALRVFDYDYQRIPIQSDFKSKPAWFVSREDINKTKALANKNTISRLRKKGRTKKGGREKGQQSLGG